MFFHAFKCIFRRNPPYDLLLNESQKLLVFQQPQADCLAPRSSPDPRCRPDHRITITSTLRLDPSTPVSTRRKTHPILDRQPKTQPVIPCPPPHPQSLGSPMPVQGGLVNTRTGQERLPRQFLPKCTFSVRIVGP